MRSCSVSLTKKAIRNLQTVPHYIADKFQLWVDLVENEGMAHARKIKSYHDEPLRGKRKGQRSIRLSQAYRAIYTEAKSGKLNIVEVQEVNKHDY